MAYFFVLGWPWDPEESQIQKKTFELLRKNRLRAPFSMKVNLVDLGRLKIVMVWDDSQMSKIEGIGGLWGKDSVIRRWVKESTGGDVYQDADVVGPRSHGLEGLLSFKGIIESFQAP